jgi:acyl-CoA thioester hydrolase
MFQTEFQIRVRYGETDRMGYVYYGNYAQYFEVARVEALRTLGISYKQMEAGGIMLPVYTYSVKFLRPAHYDDLLTIRTCIPKMPSARITFLFETYNERGELLNTAEVVLAFCNAQTSRPCPPPESFSALIAKYF